MNREPLLWDLVTVGVIGFALGVIVGAALVKI